MMMCEPCIEAARTGNMFLHCGKPDCACQHYPVGHCQVERDGIRRGIISVDVVDIPQTNTYRYRASTCPVCGKTVAATKNNRVYRHKDNRNNMNKWGPTCPGSGRPANITEWVTWDE